jgi:hypothetical protein
MAKEDSLSPLKHLEYPNTWAAVEGKGRGKGGIRRMFLKENSRPSQLSLNCKYEAPPPSTTTVEFLGHLPPAPSYFGTTLNALTYILFAKLAKKKI